MYIYKETWMPIIGELTCAIEDDDEWDSYAVEVGTVVGHVQCRISAACNLFLEQGGKYS